MHQAKVSDSFSRQNQLTNLFPLELRKLSLERVTPNMATSFCSCKSLSCAKLDFIFAIIANLLTHGKLNMVFFFSHENEQRLKIEDGVIQDTSGDVIFKVEFMAIACMPQRDEVLDGRIIEVVSTGIQVQSGPIETFIPLKVSKSLASMDHALTLLSFGLDRKTALSMCTIPRRSLGCKRTKLWTSVWKGVCGFATGSLSSSTSITSSASLARSMRKSSAPIITDTSTA